MTKGMKLSREDIQRLMGKATKGPWGCSDNTDDWPTHFCTIFQKANRQSEILSTDDLSEEDLLFIAALPDIASTALSLYDRVEKLEEENNRLGGAATFNASGEEHNRN